MRHLALWWVAWMGGRGVEGPLAVALLVQEELGLWEEWMAAGLGAHSTGQQGGKGRRHRLRV